MDVLANTQTNPACVMNATRDNDDWQVVLSLLRDQLQSDYLQLDAEQLLYQTAEAARHLFLLREGKVRLFKTLPNGQQHLLHLVQAGDVFGFDGLVDHFYNHSAQAVTIIGVCRMNIQHLQALSRHYPQLERLIMVRCLRDLQHADERRLMRFA